MGTTTSQTGLFNLEFLHLSEAFVSHANDLAWHAVTMRHSKTKTRGEEIYMNQAMVADLGSEALNQLKSVEIHGLKLVSPSLWLSSGAAKLMNFLEHFIIYIDLRQYRRLYRICLSLLYCYFCSKLQSRKYIF